MPEKKVNVDGTSEGVGASAYKARTDLNPRIHAKELASKKAEREAQKGLSKEDGGDTT